MHLHIYKDAGELSDAAAAWITEKIQQTLKEKEFFTLALSGGETPKKLYQKLAVDPYRNKIEWNKVHIFWGDERVVPPDDERGNAKMAFKNLLNKVTIPAEQIHRINTETDPEESAKVYEKVLHKYFDRRPTTFDLVLLGMGDDGHILSLFPDSKHLADKMSWVVADKEQKGMKRITLLPSVVNRSAAIAFLVTGENKATVLKEVLQGSASNKYPAQLIQPANGELFWFIDEAAGKLLN